METPINLSICQECKSNPAVYGDGATWARCSGCQLKHNQETVPDVANPSPRPEEVNPVAPVQQDPVLDPDGSFEHVIVPGLTSIILPVYMVNYTLFHYTGNCIGSVREHTQEGTYELVVVDNGSPVQPPDVNSYYAHRVIKNEKNLGVTKAWNQGIRMSIGEYIVLLNNDVQVFEHWLTDMKDVLDKFGYDLVMAHPMYSKTEPFARALEAKKIRDAAKASGQNQLSTFKDFSCVMFKRSLIEELGMFDEDYFNYASDSDFFKRMDEAGKRWICANYVATSHISDATGFAVKGTPEIMNKDKEIYRLKWENKTVTEVPASPEVINKLKETIDEQKKIMNQKASEYAEGVSKDWTPPVVPPKKEGVLVRSDYTGDAIFLKGKDGKFHHITSPDVLHALGFEFGQEQIVESIESMGDDITMTNYKDYE